MQNVDGGLREPLPLRSTVWATPVIRDGERKGGPEKEGEGNAEFEVGFVGFYSIS